MIFHPIQLATRATRAAPATEVQTAPEWLLTNGIGGYAMGTLHGVNTRRYHGLLVAATSPPVGRVVALHSMIEQLDLGGKWIDLSTQHFGEEPLVHPQGWRLIDDVAITLPGEVRWRFAIDPHAQLVRTLRLAQGRNSATITYELHSTAPHGASLLLRPLIALRDFHSLNRIGDAPLTVSSIGTDGVRVVRDTQPPLALDLTMPGARFSEEQDWWRNFAYTLDRDRGQDWHEDVLSPGTFRAELAVNGRVELTATLALPRQFEFPPLKPPATNVQQVANSPSERSRLEAAAGQFIVHRPVGDEDSVSIIAGYPWFADWGRDTMIALPGLLLTTGRLAEAERALLTFARHIRNGLLPNRFDDHGGAAHYNTVDAGLWFVYAVAALMKCVPDAASRDELAAACLSIIRAYRAGTDFGIHMDPADGLIAAGDESTQLTWMDAQRDGVTFTPRHGKPIEINALWHHALHCAADLTPPPMDKHEADDLRSLARTVALSMQRHFWNESAQCCFDVLTPIGDAWNADASIRPNQIFAVSLNPSPFPPERQKLIVGVVREKLLTPFGLRTLDPGHPAYRGRFEGTLMDRDAAYHQGTVWPWLIGPYCEAVLRVGGWSDDAKREVRAAIQPLLHQLERASGEGTCAGQIPEVYDGDAPHRAGGCPAQAWSVAELLRVLELLETAPGCDRYG